MPGMFRRVSVLLMNSLLPEERQKTKYNLHVVPDDPITKKNKKNARFPAGKNNLGHISSWIIKYLPVVAGKYLPLIYLPYDVPQPDYCS